MNKARRRAYRKLLFFWSRWADSNRRPTDYESTEAGFYGASSDLAVLEKI